MKKVRHSYKHLRSVHGEGWADRLWAHQEHDMPQHPEGDVFMRGCPSCAVYGCPGWVVVDRSHWSKCVNCNYDGDNQTGRDVYKQADQTHQVDGGKWMPV